MKRSFLIAFIAIILLISNSNLKGQCIVKAKIDTVEWNTPYHICLGDSVDLNSFGTCGFLMNNNFNNSTLGAGWQTNVTALYSNPCPPTGLPAQGVALWFGANAYPRELITIGYDMSLGGCSIDWDMKYGGNQNTANCESPDLPTEGVHLQWSINNGATWTQFPGTDQAPSGSFGNPGYINGSGGYWTPVSGNAATGPYYTWNHYHNTMPAGSVSANTKIRWYQDVASGNTFDHWGIDNVQIVCPAYAYVEWSYDGVTSFYDYNPPPVTPTTPGTHLYIVSVVDLLSGANAKDTITVIVHSPVVDAGPPSTTICTGDSAILVASGVGMSNFQWLTNPITYNDSLIVSPTISTVYTVRAQDYLGCKAKDSILVNFFPKPVITITNGSACEGDTAILSASGGYYYQWSNGDTTASIAVGITTTTSYQVTVTTLLGCSDTASATASINPKPIIQLTDNTTICIGDNATLTAGGGTIYLWSTGATTPSISVNPTSLTSYTVAVTDANGCFDSKSVDVDVIALPVPMITQEVDTICKGTSTTLTASGGTTYLWTTGETASSILISPYVTSVYSVTASNSLNNVVCSANASTQMNVRNCNMIYIPNSFSPYGYNTVFKPLGEIKSAKNYSFQIFNRWGQLIFETNDPEQGWDGKLNGEYVPHGAYIYYLNFDNVDEKYEKVGTVTILL
jgi:gliding motility-associated-like protein